MVTRVIQLVYKEIRGLHQAAYVLALLAFGSQMLALIRDRLLAHQFGAGYELDVYYAAFRVPDLMYVLFASTLSVYVLIPFVSRHMSINESSRARDLLSQVFTLFLLVYIVTAVVLFVLAPSFVMWLFPGLSEQSEQLVLLLRILLLQPFFLGISSLFGVVTQLNHRFVLYAISPLIYNLGIIFGVVVLYPLVGLAGLAYGVVLGAIGHMLIQWPLVRASNLSFSWIGRFNWAEIGSVLRTSIPRAITLSLNQIVLLILVGMASTMTVGSVAVFQFGYNLQSVPLAIIGVSYSVAAFPTLSEFWSKGELVKFRDHVLVACKHIIFWSVPAIVLSIVLRAQLVRVVLGSGAFNWEDTRLTAAVLALLIISLTAHAMSLLLVRAFYAGGYTRLPFYAIAVGSVTSVGTAYAVLDLFTTSPTVRTFLEVSFRVVDVPGTEILALAFGYTVALLLQAVLLCLMANRALGVYFGGLLRNIGEASMAAVVGGIAAYVTLNFIVAGINPNTFIGIFLQGGLAGLAGLTGVILAYRLLGSNELEETYRSFQGKLFKTDIVAPQKELL